MTIHSACVPDHNDTTRSMGDGESKLVELTPTELEIVLFSLDMLLTNIRAFDDFDHDEEFVDGSEREVRLES